MIADRWWSSSVLTGLRTGFIRGVADSGRQDAKGPRFSDVGGEAGVGDAQVVRRGYWMKQGTPCAVQWKAILSQRASPRIKSPCPPPSGSGTVGLMATVSVVEVRVGWNHPGAKRG